ncbi:protein LSD1 isoform X2 [Brassica rapa]|nr:protein LSD1 isoform X2 [Brassica rapa]
MESWFLLRRIRESLVIKYTFFFDLRLRYQVKTKSIKLRKKKREINRKPICPLLHLDWLSSSIAPSHVLQSEMQDQLVCHGCRNTLLYPRGATNVRCALCNTVNQFAHINCGNCRTTLMYPYGASSVKCAVCQFVTNVNMGNRRVPNMPNGAASPGTMSTQSTPPSKTQTVVVENPMSVNESGKLVSNVVVGVTTCKK